MWKLANEDTMAPLRRALEAEKASILAYAGELRLSLEDEHTRAVDEEQARGEGLAPSLQDMRDYSHKLQSEYLDPTPLSLLVTGPETREAGHRDAAQSARRDGGGAAAAAASAMPAMRNAHGSALGGRDGDGSVGGEAQVWRAQQQAAPEAGGGGGGSGRPRGGGGGGGHAHGAMPRMPLQARPPSRSMPGGAGALKAGLPPRPSSVQKLRSRVHVARKEL